MAFSQVQTATIPAASTANSFAITLSATTQYNLVVVHIRVAGLTETCTGVTDNVGNTYVVQTVVANATERLYQAYGYQTTGGATTVTVSFSASTLNKRCGADEYSGFAVNTTNASIFDASTTGTAVGTLIEVSTLTPASSGELIVASFCHDNNVTLTAGTDYTKYAGGAQEPITVHSQYRLSSDNTETAPATINTSTNSSERATAFKVGVSNSLIKTYNGLATASVKTIDGLAIASRKTWNGVI